MPPVKRIFHLCTYAGMLVSAHNSLPGSSLPDCIHRLDWCFPAARSQPRLETLKQNQSMTAKKQNKRMQSHTGTTAICPVTPQLSLLMWHCMQMDCLMANKRGCCASCVSSCLQGSRVSYCRPLHGQMHCHFYLCLQWSVNTGLQPSAGASAYDNIPAQHQALLALDLHTEQ